MTRKYCVLGAAAVAALVFAAAALLYRPTTQDAGFAVDQARNLVRDYSPVLGPQNAPVTIVEFFDPSCEACRAFFPIVKRILADHLGQVRLVLRYTTFHQGSDEAVRILETARIQGVFDAVLSALVETQPRWAIHGTPRLDRAWDFAGSVGLNVAKAKEDARSAKIDSVLNQDAADVRAFNIKGTPTFFVNGRSLAKFGPQELIDLVKEEVAKARKS